METRLNTIKLNMENTGIFGSEIRRNRMVYKYQVLVASISQVFNQQIVQKLLSGQCCYPRAVYSGSQLEHSIDSSGPLAGL